MASYITSEFDIINYERSIERLYNYAPARARPGTRLVYRAHARIKYTVELRGWG